MTTDNKTQSQLYCLLLRMAALKLRHVEVASRGLPKLSRVMAKAQNSVNVEEDINCRGLHKALGDFGKSL